MNSFATISGAAVFIGRILLKSDPSVLVQYNPNVDEHQIANSFMLY